MSAVDEKLNTHVDVKREKPIASQESDAGKEEKKKSVGSDEDSSALSGNIAAIDVKQKNEGVLDAQYDEDHLKTLSVRK